MPPTQRRDPLHLQIARFYEDRILSGDLRPPHPIPPIRDIAATSGVGQNTAQRAVEYLKAGRLVATGPGGTVVAPRRAAIGPQERLRLTARPSSEADRVTFAGLVPAPAYILPILGLAEGDAAARREWVTLEGGGVSRLTVTWCAASAAEAVPELLAQEPLPDPRGAAAMIAGRTGRRVAWGGTAFECRPVLDDGREMPLLRLGPGACVLAGVYTWSDGGQDGDVLEYGEFAVPPGRVIKTYMEP